MSYCVWIHPCVALFTISRLSTHHQSPRRPDPDALRLRGGVQYLQGICGYMWLSIVSLQCIMVVYGC